MFVWSPEVTDPEGRFHLQRKPSFSRTVMPALGVIVLPTGVLLVVRGIEAAERLGDPQGMRLTYLLCGAFLLFLCAVAYAGLTPLIRWEVSREPGDILQIRRKLFGVPLRPPIRFDLRHLRLSHYYRSARVDRFGNAMGEAIEVVARYRGEFFKLLPDLTPEAAAKVLPGPLRRLASMPAEEVVWRDAHGDVPALSMADYYHRVRTLIAALEARIGAGVHTEVLESFLKWGPDRAVSLLAWQIVDRGLKIPSTHMTELLFLLDGEVPPERLPPHLAEHVAD